MALSPAITRGLNNRIAALSEEAIKLRTPNLAVFPGITESANAAADLADAAIAAAQSALCGEMTTAEAFTALQTYTAATEAPRLRRLMERW